jgi:putative protease
MERRCVMAEKFIGKVTHFFSKIGVAGIELEYPLAKGNRIHINGYTTDLDQIVRSMEVGHKKIECAHPGDTVAILVEDKVRENDSIYLVTEEELTAV